MVIARKRVGWAVLGMVLAGAAVAAEWAGAGFYDAAPRDDPAAAGRCDWGGPRTRFIFQESDYIRAYFEPTDLGAYAQALP